MSVNKLILGDNLEILKAIETESVDLIYLDPPFFSNRDYEVIWGDAGEVRSFQDRWSGGVDHYIAWLSERVEQMHRVLKQTGSIFLHCDWHANAHIRVLILDKIFKPNNFRNEIIWSYTGNSIPQKCLPRKHDMIFWYSKSNKCQFYPNNILIPYSPLTEKRYNHTDEEGKRYKVSALRDGKQEVVYMKEGKYPDTVWSIPVIRGKESIGYPTQKPEALLERIIKMASNEGDVVLDPFVGGGTTVAVADKLKRQWIGIDQSVQAVKVTELRLQKQTDLFTSIYANSYSLQLHKYDYDTLRNSNAFEFETWIIHQFGGVPQNKKGGDKGVDGKSNDGTPIQAKRSDNVGVNVVKNFSVSAKQYDKILFEKNKAAQKPVGRIIAFSFGKGAIQEAARLKNEENIIIQLIKVEEIIPLSKKPNIIVKISEVLRDDATRDIEFIAEAKSDAGIEFYSWDFDYDESRGFKPHIIRDVEGHQQRKLDAGTYHIAVKAVDNDGLEGVEVIKLKVNGMVERG